MGQLGGGATLGLDANNNPIQGAAPAWTDADATGTPQVSPIATGTSTVSLVWPAKAYALFVQPTAAPAVLSSDGSISSFTIPQNNGGFQIPGKPGDTTKIKRPVTTPLEFIFLLTT